MEACCICFETIDDKATLSCKHSFCTPCIRKWLDDHESCPMCRADISVMELEEARLESYEGWSNPPIEPEILAASGFYWIGYCGLTRCAFCDIIMKWAPEVCPMKIHQAVNPGCPFFAGKESMRHRVTGGITVIFLNHSDL